MVDEQDHDRTDDRHEHAVEIEAGDAFSPESGKQKAADDRADDPQHNVADQPFARLILLTILLPIKPAIRPKNQPADDRYRVTF
jgi:hypothetical protein